MPTLLSTYSTLLLVPPLVFGRVRLWAPCRRVDPLKTQFIWLRIRQQFVKLNLATIAADLSPFYLFLCCPGP